jgi:hypothetical protein
MDGWGMVVEEGLGVGAGHRERGLEREQLALLTRIHIFASSCFSGKQNIHCTIFLFNLLLKKKKKKNNNIQTNKQTKTTSIQFTSGKYLCQSYHVQRGHFVMDTMLPGSVSKRHDSTYPAQGVWGEKHQVLQWRPL